MTAVKPWMETMASGNPYFLQQDGALAHTSHLVQNWFFDNVDMFWFKEFWPLDSLDFNPLDYYVWSIIEKVTNKFRHPNIVSFQAAIEIAFAGLDRQQLKRACTSGRESKL